MRTIAETLPAFVGSRLDGSTGYARKGQWLASSSASPVDTGSAIDDSLVARGRNMGDVREADPRTPACPVSAWRTRCILRWSTRPATRRYSTLAPSTLSRGFSAELLGIRPKTPASRASAWRTRYILGSSTRPATRYCGAEALFTLSREFSAELLAAHPKGDRTSFSGCIRPAGQFALTAGAIPGNSALGAVGSHDFVGARTGDRPLVLHLGKPTP